MLPPTMRWLASAAARSRLRPTRAGLRAPPTSPLLALLLCALSAHAHVCLLHPVQRGGYNVSDPGDNSCFQPNACTVAPATPTTTLSGAQVHHVLLQQNLNHFSPGWQGFIDVAFATLADAEAGVWQTLATVPDFFAHSQAAQTNFTVPVLIPAGACAHCVLRVRYDPHKPTEVVFYNCADVAVEDAPTPPPPAGALLALVSPGAPVSARSEAVAVARIAPSGVAQIIATAVPGVQLQAGVSASLRGTLYTLARNSTAAAGAPASLLVAVDSADGATAVRGIALPAGDAAPPLQWTALSAVPGWPVPALVLLGIAAGTAPGTFVYQARTLDAASGVASAVLALSAAQDTFVNVMQLTVGVAAGADAATLYLLAGDENSLFALNAAVFTIPLSPAAAAAPAAITSAVVDHSAFTFTNLHASRGGALRAVSPGLYSSDPNEAAWALVDVNAATGAVTRLGAIAGGGAGRYAPLYSGAVYGDEPAAGASLLHIFQHVLDGSFAVATLDAETGALVTAPTLLNGVNNELLFDTPVFVAGAAEHTRARAHSLLRGVALAR